MPPYLRDLAGAGKGRSDGWMFWDAFNAEMATGGVLEGHPPVESCAWKHDIDYLKFIN